MATKVGAFALGVSGLLAGLVLGQVQGASAQPAPQKVTVKVVKVQVKPPVGYVLTSRGRKVKIDGPEGCHVLRYDEITKEKVGDPGDGEWYCP